ncbi:pyridoxamine 5'-phosphate oxidase family protein [Candidatus Poriferisodalis sp.]|uniref:pyridoxamine 5'-phosphate oxidase family protein n=1 Tax=Candidatus Poriferisodalis sp. TaxID=3101277 RepID=UPI003B026165
MSIPVAPADIAGQLEHFGTAAYIVTVRDDATPHIGHVTLRLEGEVLRCPASRSAVANVAQRPSVSVLWPPHEPGGYSMIVDAAAQTVDGTGGAELELRPTSGVLHRPAPAASDVAGAPDAACAADCAPLCSTHA